MKGRKKGMKGGGKGGGGVTVCPMSPGETRRVMGPCLLPKVRVANRRPVAVPQVAMILRSLDVLHYVAGLLFFFFLKRTERDPRGLEGLGYSYHPSPISFSQSNLNQQLCELRESSANR